MPSRSRRESVLIVDAARLNAMQGVCDSARIWSRSRGEDKSRAERDLLRALAHLSELPDSTEEE